MIPSNYHTHTCFDDGCQTPEELVQEAIRLGCRELGFSGHSYTPFDESYCMTQQGTEAYVAAVKAVQEKYKDRIRVYLGIELDYYAEIDTTPYEYRIGSVHYVKKDGVYLPIDDSKETQIENVNKFYGGDFYGFVEDYYKTVADVYRKTNCQIVAHFDLITKFNRDQTLFDPQHPRYRAAAEYALGELLKAPVTLEVNMGAMARGYATQPYPAPEILSRWLASGKPVMYAADCHDARKLLFGYDTYIKYIESFQP